MTILNLISVMPYDIKYYILKYLRIPTIIITNKENYILYHKNLRPYIIKNNIENYIRNMIINDCDFIFQQLIIENVEKWLILKDYIYKNHIYKNYIYFLILFCIEHKSIRCYNTINNFLKQKQLCQNRHKKNIIKCIK